MTAALLVGTLLLLAACSDSKSLPPRPEAAKAARTPAQATGPGAEVASLLAGIPQRGNALGNPTAPVTLQYFGDLQCPFCRQFTFGALPVIIRRWVRSGTLRIEYRSMKTATRELETFKSQQIAALAAGKQNRLWDFIDLFYREQGRENSGYVDEDFLQGLAQQVPGLNLLAWTVARNDPALLDALIGDDRTVQRAGFRGTPAFLLGRTGGALRPFAPGSNISAAPYNAAIEDVLRGSRRSRQLRAIFA